MEEEEQQIVYVKNLETKETLCFTMSLNTLVTAFKPQVALRFGLPFDRPFYLVHRNTFLESNLSLHKNDVRPNELLYMYFPVVQRRSDAFNLFTETLHNTLRIPNETEIVLYMTNPSTGETIRIRSTPQVVQQTNQTNPNDSQNLTQQNTQLNGQNSIQHDQQQNVPDIETIPNFSPFSFFEGSLPLTQQTQQIGSNGSTQNMNENIEAISQNLNTQNNQNTNNTLLQQQLNRQHEQRNQLIPPTQNNNTTRRTQRLQNGVMRMPLGLLPQRQPITQPQRQQQVIQQHEGSSTSSIYTPTQNVPPNQTNQFPTDLYLEEIFMNIQQLLTNQQHIFDTQESTPTQLPFNSSMRTQQPRVRDQRDNTQTSSQQLPQQAEQQQPITQLPQQLPQQNPLQNWLRPGQTVSVRIFEMPTEFLQLPPAPRNVVSNVVQHVNSERQEVHAEPHQPVDVVSPDVRECRELLYEMLQILVDDEKREEVIKRIIRWMQDEFRTPEEIVGNMINSIAKYLKEVLEDSKFDKKVDLMRDVLNTIYNNLYDYCTEHFGDVDAFANFFRKTMYDIIELNKTHNIEEVFDLIHRCIRRIITEGQPANKIGEENPSSIELEERFLLGVRRCHDTYQL
ncbi:hypothetical protein EIN_374300 [Entamoeba invadens IP1]|uniref:Ubiquitin-like domain-containing protein n=1 Tax=Entamoeba invadens IP1 TaxID=370355 RepID=A0A0A1TU38_ENTIV|nr:hypothetical protein EIN_374300 [Entamoeba invadens IP1]ELP83415.1 hypothetical protein EIN_374300 [Entamoeba invadens IP1]|eukprot:XP_004182761.1 hypothetical protein EIN_374300 [Entamoeba invadens IP1]